MKKSHPYTTLSNIRCACGKQIKERLARKGHKTCYDCYRKEQAAAGNFTSTAREVRVNPKLQRKARRIASGAQHV